MRPHRDCSHRSSVTPEVSVRAGQGPRPPSLSTHHGTSSGSWFLVTQARGPCLTVSSGCGRERCLLRSSSAKLGWVPSAAMVQASLRFLFLEVVLPKRWLSVVQKLSSVGNDPQNCQAAVAICACAPVPSEFLNCHLPRPQAQQRLRCPWRRKSRSDCRLGSGWKSSSNSTG